MLLCDNLVHPFQNEPGTSQRQRVLDNLLSGSAKIDGRSMADLLDYFVQLSRHINYYNSDLSITDWQPFFQKSIPFSLAAIIKYDNRAVAAKVDGYTAAFNKRPSRAGLQLLFQYFFQQVINRVNTWSLQLKGSGLPAELIIEKLIKDKLKDPLYDLVCYNNVAVEIYCVKPLDFQSLAQNPVWALTAQKLNRSDCKPEGKTKRKRLIALYEKVKELLPVFSDAVRIIADTASQSMEQSFFPLKEELQKQHTPHLALLFAFLKLFQHLQQDLNGYTKKHLDFFYKQVLRLQPRAAVADKAHIVVEIQKQLDKYLLKKGLLVKDGKDNNKAEILFSLEDELVVNKTQVADKRTLFLNNENSGNTTFLEGVYVAPNADKADGMLKDFKDPATKSFATLGAKLGKYTDPENKFVKQYPNARLGFILASPVLLLNEGKRTISITLACHFENDYCNTDKAQAATRANCCAEPTPPGQVSVPTPLYPDFADASFLYEPVVKALNETYFYLSEDIIAACAKAGMDKDTENKVRDFLTSQIMACYSETIVRKFDEVLVKSRWDAFLATLTPAGQQMLAKLITPRKALRIYFSGENEWIEPQSPAIITMSPLPGAGNTFTLKIDAVLETDKPAVTFYNKDKLKEDVNSTLPLVKIELDDSIKLAVTAVTDPATGRCCLVNDITDSPDDQLYFCITQQLITDASAGLSAKARNYLQQLLTPANNFQKRIALLMLDCFLDARDENNQLIFTVTDQQTIKTLANDITKKYCAPAKQPVSLYHFFRNVKVLESIDSIPDSDTRIDVQVCGLKNFVVQNDDGVQDVNAQVYPFGTRPVIEANFYIGSFEVFNKNWKTLHINHNWKNKPANFEEYYTAYQHMFIDPNDLDNKIIDGIIKDNNYKVSIAVLENGDWHNNGAVVCDDTGVDANNLLFRSMAAPPASFCSDSPGKFEYSYKLDRTIFGLANTNSSKERPVAPLTRLDANTRDYFLRVTLKCQDFQHSRYAFILSRQMMAFGRLPNDLLAGAYYRVNPGNAIIVFNNVAALAGDLENDISDLQTDAANTKSETADTVTEAQGGGGTGAGTAVETEALEADSAAQTTVNTAGDVQASFDELKINIPFLPFFTPSNRSKLEAVIPNEPWTPVIKNISIDYTASATKSDIDLIHLYPYQNTYKKEDITLQPALFPTFCDEGSLFLGLQDLEPGSNVNMLFQLAEATADAESDPEGINWYYLENNQWKLLRNGFEVLEDDTGGLTTSGIVKFALPQNMTKGNTILPGDLHWIKASIPKNSKTVCETLGIYTQAVKVAFTNEAANDKLRLSAPLPAGSVSKLNEADTNVKKIVQPYDSFGGRRPEEDGGYYVRVSELLRHKGRAVQKFDYERLALEYFPQLFKAKCINHSFGLNAHVYKNDFPVAPGYVLLAVIPDLNQLKAIQSFEPRVPVSMLEAIAEKVRSLTSPFVRFRAMNPRYEKVDFCIKLKLLPGKDENYYKEKLQQDLREFMAPWAVGGYDKLTFGQCISRSEIIGFIESLDYADYIVDLLMRHSNDGWPAADARAEPVCPKTPRSILIAGDIDVCIAGKDCETWQTCHNTQGQEVDCCNTEKVPVADYCIKDIIG